MSGSSRLPARRAIPRGLIGMLVLVALAEFALTRYRTYFAEYSAECWRSSREAAQRMTRSEIFVFGSSLSKHGVLPLVIERETGNRTYNLAVFSGPAAASFFLLRSALEAGARPSAVLLDCQDGPLDANTRRERDAALVPNMRYWPELLDLRDLIDLTWSTQDTSFFAAMVLSKTLTSYRCRFELRSAIRALAEGKNPSTRTGLKTLHRNWAINRGAHVRQANRAYQDQLEADAESRKSSALNPFDFEFNYRNKPALAYARRFIELADRFGIMVFWLMPPISPLEQAKRDLNGCDDYLTRVARLAQSVSHNVVVVDARRSNYRTWGFADAVHLDRYGAASYSSDLAVVVGQHLAHPGSLPRWNALPEARHRELPIRIEDLFESATLMESLKLRR